MCLLEGKRVSRGTFQLLLGKRIVLFPFWSHICQGPCKKKIVKRKMWDLILPIFSGSWNEPLPFYQTKPKKVKTSPSTKKCFAFLLEKTEFTPLHFGTRPIKIGETFPHKMGSMLEWMSISAGLCPARRRHLLFDSVCANWILRMSNCSSVSENNLTLRK